MCKLEASSSLTDFSIKDRTETTKQGGEDGGEALESGEEKGGTLLPYRSEQTGFSAKH